MGDSLFLFDPNIIIKTDNKMNLNNSADISNIAIKLSRLARKIGVNTNDYPLLVSGNPAQCLEFSKRVVFFVVKEVAQDMINRRITISVLFLLYSTC